MTPITRFRVRGDTPDGLGEPTNQGAGEYICLRALEQLLCKLLRAGKVYLHLDAGMVNRRVI